MRAPFAHVGTIVAPAAIEDCTVLSDLHAAVFSRGWSESEFEAMLRQPGAAGLIARYRSAFGRTTLGGFALYRVAADEGEVISIGVVAECRRRGIGRALIEQMLRNLYREHVASVTLEVEEENRPAIALYRAFEFEPVGERPGYYVQGRPRPSGAIVMRRRLR
ncbi:GNAT family N-acetyltransferase [Faunimonas sp. B44]|uniref:GNAT family N-acetyltransferase n=1 Tax=Faunimonas sp. B44 TaxID=3461493 RepID=UPI004044A63D